MRRPNDEVTEIPNPLAAQAPQMQPNRSQQPMPNIPPEQFINLTPQQRVALAQGQALPPHVQQQLQAQQRPPQAQQGPQTDQEIHKRIINMSQELDQATPRAAAIPVSPQDRQKMDAVLKHHWKSISALPKVLVHQLKNPKNEETVKSVLGLRIQIVRQLRSPSTPNLADELSMTEKTFTEYITKISGYVVGVIKIITAQQNGNAAQGANGQQMGQPQQNAMPQVPQQPKQESAPEGPKHRRNISKPPPAPTDDRRTFNFGGPQSPQGTPIYAQTAGAIDLKLPPGKKQRTKQTPSAAPTPATAMATPGPAGSPPINKAAEKKGQTAPTPPTAKQEPQKPVFRCPVAGCPRQANGFETQPELDLHRKEMHVAPADPVSYVLDKVRNAMDLDAEGKPKVDEKAALKDKAAALQKLPKGTTAGATPMAKAGSLNGKPSPSKTPQQGTKMETPLPAKAADAVKNATAEGGADSEIAFHDLLGDLGILEEMRSWDDSNDLFGGAAADFAPTADATDDSTEDKSKWDWLSQMAGTTDWFDSEPSTTSSSSKTDSSPPLSSPPSSVGRTPQSKKSPELNENGKRSRDVSEGDNLEMNLTITDTDSELEELMSAWADGNVMQIMGSGDSAIGMGTGEMEFGGMKVGTELLNAPLDGGEDAWMEGMMDFDGIPGWES